MQRHIEQLKATVLNDGLYRASLADLKSKRPNYGTLAAFYEAVTGMRARPGATKTELFRGLAMFGIEERRCEARAEVSRLRMPI